MSKPKLVIGLVIFWIIAVLFTLAIPTATAPGITLAALFFWVGGAFWGTCLIATLMNDWHTKHDIYDSKSEHYEI